MKIIPFSIITIIACGALVHADKERCFCLIDQYPAEYLTKNQNLKQATSIIKIINLPGIAHKDLFENFLESKIFHEMLNIAPPKLHSFYWTSGETCKKYDMVYSSVPLSLDRLDAIVMSCPCFN